MSAGESDESDGSDASGESPLGRRRRWLVIGAVLETMVGRGGGTMCRGLWLNWRGRVHPFAPCEFLSWHEVLAAVIRRLEQAGLELVTWACARERVGEYVLLRVEVKRNGKKKPANRYGLRRNLEPGVEAAGAPAQTGL